MAGDAAAIGQLTRGQPRTIAWVRRHTFEIVLVLPLVAYITVLTIAPILDTFRLKVTLKTGNNVARVGLMATLNMGNGDGQLCVSVSTACATAS